MDLVASRRLSSGSPLGDPVDDWKLEGCSFVDDWKAWKVVPDTCSRVPSWVKVAESSLGLTSEVTGDRSQIKYRWDQSDTLNATKQEDKR
jgi:hypothetical protein